MKVFLRESKKKFNVIWIYFSILFKENLADDMIEMGIDEEVTEDGEEIVDNSIFTIKKHQGKKIKNCFVYWFRLGFKKLKIQTNWFWSNYLTISISRYILFKAKEKTFNVFTKVKEKKLT